LNIAFNNQFLPAHWSDGRDAYRLHPAFLEKSDWGSKKMETPTEIFLQLGFSQKHLSYNVVDDIYQLPWWRWWGVTNSMDSRYAFYYRRIALRVGIRL